MPKDKKKRKDSSESESLSDDSSDEVKVNFPV